MATGVGGEQTDEADGEEDTPPARPVAVAAGSQIDKRRDGGCSMEKDSNGLRSARKRR
uniref:Uncharacterized protein n=1 Tax=Oryza sativa subsp. japonica TaxID=39947 RepID=Q6YSX3_ORYSJ|nr:hypothetical protein [Oryza sativa Japonica Group]BAD32002.1 hypothetical protein [Oryza sativa Japonica Group]